MLTGVEVFLKGLRDLGYEPVVLDGKPDHVAIDYTVESGKFAGTKLKHGFIVPAEKFGKKALLELRRIGKG